MVPPLLADVIRHVVVPRFEQHRVEQLARGIGDAPLVEFSIAADIGDIGPIDTRVDLPQAQVDSPQAQVGSSESRVNSPQAQVASPEAEDVRPEARVGSPGTRVGSSESRVDSPEPHVVIFGPAAAALAAAFVRRRNLRVLTLSADLTVIHGPEAGDSNPLTPDVLADLLLAISQAI